MSQGELLLEGVLARVSRSFYLSLVLLPRETRATTALAYLLARAADTVADTRLVPAAHRLEQLDALAATFQGQAAPPARAALLAELAALEQSPDATPEEHRLLRELEPCLAALEALPPLEQGLVRRVLATLTSGMQADLRRFGDEACELRALETRAELRTYCYEVAGCVGEFWSRLHAARLPRVGRRVRAELGPWVEDGVALGRALQLTNVLRDLRRDLAHGRCYLPRQDLAAHGLVPADLLDPDAWPRLRPLYRELVDVGLRDAWAGVRYTRQIPSHAFTLRLAGLLPLLLAVRTLGAVLAGNPLAAPAKVSRGVVYRALGQALLTARDERGLGRLFRATLREAGLSSASPPRRSGP
ncbi:MAG: squalene/phytoene synthase family protein [Planctomycetota bacterium]